MSLVQDVTFARQASGHRRLVLEVVPLGVYHDFLVFRRFRRIDVVRFRVRRISWLPVLFQWFQVSFQFGVDRYVIRFTVLRQGVQRANCRTVVVYRDPILGRRFCWLEAGRVLRVVFGFLFARIRFMETID